MIPVKIGDNGARVFLRDVATIKDGFTEGERYFKYNGRNAISIQIRGTKTQNIIPIAESVHKFIDEHNTTLPDGLELKVLVDMTYYLNGRLDMMLNNLVQGAILVFIMLFIFLRFKLAFWVMVGFPVCFLGAMMMMPVFGLTINISELEFNFQLRPLSLSFPSTDNIYLYFKNSSIFISFFKYFL